MSWPASLVALWDANDANSISDPASTHIHVWKCESSHRHVCFRPNGFNEVICSWKHLETPGVSLSGLRSVCHMRYEEERTPRRQFWVTGKRNAGEKDVKEGHSEVRREEGKETGKEMWRGRRQGRRGWPVYHSRRRGWRGGPVPVLSRYRQFCSVQQQIKKTLLTIYNMEVECRSHLSTPSHVTRKTDAL